MHDLGTDKASLKTGKRITIHKVEHYEVLDTSFWPINIEKDMFKKRNPNISNLIFSSVALQVPQPLALHLLLTVFSHAQHDTVCACLQISVQAKHHSVLISKGTAFTYSTVNIKEVQVVCHWAIEEYSNKWNIKLLLKTVAFRNKCVLWKKKKIIIPVSVFERTKNKISPHLSNFITNSIKCQFDHLGFILHVM